MGPLQSPGESFGRKSFPHRCTTAGQSAPGRKGSFGIGLALSAAASLLLAGAAPALAEEPIIRDHRSEGPVIRDHRRGAVAARVTVFLSDFQVESDGDLLSSGDFVLSAWMYECRDARCSVKGGLLVDAKTPFSGDSGKSTAMRRSIPSRGGLLGPDTLGPGVVTTPDMKAGLPLRPGRRYGLFFDLDEGDFVPLPTFDPPCLKLALVLSPDNGWGIGRLHRSQVNTGCGNQLETVEASGWITYQVKLADLPDLVPVNLTLRPIPGSTDRAVCTGVQNQGTRPPAPFTVTFHLDDRLVPIGTAQAGTLPPGGYAELCARVAPLPPGPHRLSASVDREKRVLERNTENNVFIQQVGAGNLLAPIPRPGRPIAPMRP